MFVLMRTPPPPLLPGASAYEQERHREMVAEFERCSDREQRALAVAGYAVVAILVATVVFVVSVLGREIIYYDELAEERRHEWLEKQRAAISSCLNRGGYVIENARGWIKECRGAQRAP